MRTALVRSALLLATLQGRSVLRAEDGPDAQQPSASVIVGGVTPRIIIADEDEELLGAPSDSTLKADDEPKAKPGASTAFVVCCKLNQPHEESRLFVAAVPAGKPTQIPVRFRSKSAQGDAVREADQIVVNVPGTNGAESVAVGHRIQLKVDLAKPQRVRLDAAVEYRGAPRVGENELSVSGQNARFVGELALGKPALVVLETDDRGEPKHWVEFVVRFADEQADAESQESGRIYSVVYSVAGLVRVDKKPVRGKRPELDFAPLIEKIEAKVAPKSWAAAGGEGKLQTFARNTSLVVSQTSAVHEELSKFLEKLRDDEEAAQQALFERR